MRAAIILALVAALSGCATLSTPVPEDYAGPVVQLNDTGFQADGMKGIFFSALEIDGKMIKNSLMETRRVSRGQGFALTSRYTRRDVPVVPMKVKIIGTHQTAAPIHEFASRVAGTFFSVEGTVDFLPLEGQVYVVTGELSKDGSCVWIAESETSKPVTEKICERGSS